MKHCKNKIIITLILCFIILANLENNAWAYNTEYTDSKITEEKGIGVAVINDKNTNNKRYYYLFYDDNGTVHTVQYIPNEISNDSKKVWIMKGDADNAKARKFGAKEYYGSEEEIQKDENQDATKLYKKVAKDEDIGHAYDYIEGSEEDLAPSTIESIILNKVPIFDVNVFKTTAGGKEVKTDSAVGILRTITSSWYVGLRDILYIVLAILIMYNGVRLAISTIITEKTDTYKMHLFAWLKSFMFLVFMHVIIYLILYFNDFFIDSLDKINNEEGGLYNTIKTRAYEGPWNISIPATIIYITLFIMWIRVIWSYLKRMTAAIYLIIYAPLVIGRYAIESASGKKSSTIVDWTKRFATTVLIQSIHALIYVAFISPVIIHSLDNIPGFIMSLFFLNFLLSADSVFVNVFQNHLRPKTVDSLDEKFKAKEMLTDVMVGRRIAEGTFSFVRAAGGLALSATGSLASTGYTRLMDHLDDVYDEDFRSKIKKGVNKTVDRHVYSRIEDFNNRHIKPLDNENSNGQNIGNSRSNTRGRLARRKISGVRKTLRKQKNKVLQTGNRYIALKRLQRRGGLTAAYSKKVIKLKKQEYKRRFTAPFKTAGNVALGVADVVLLIPVTTVEPEAGIILFGRIPARFRKGKKTYEDNANKREEDDAVLSDTVSSLIVAQQAADRIEELLNELENGEKEKAKKEMKKMLQYNIDSYSIDEAINRFTDENDIDEIDDENLDEIVKNVIETLSNKLSQAEREQIKSRAVQIISQKASARRRINFNNTDDDSEPEEEQNEIKYGFGEIIEGIQEATIEKKTDNKYAEVVNEVIKIDGVNKKEDAKEDGVGEIININRFLDSI